MSIYKNGECCDIEIIQLNLENEDVICDNVKSKNNNGNKKFPVFYYKIIKRKGGLNISKLFSGLILFP